MCTRRLIWRYDFRLTVCAHTTFLVFLVFLVKQRCFLVFFGARLEETKSKMTGRGSRREPVDRARLAACARDENMIVDARGRRHEKTNTKKHLCELYENCDQRRTTLPSKHAIEVTARSSLRTRGSDGVAWTWLSGCSSTARGARACARRRADRHRPARRLLGLAPNLAVEHARRTSVVASPGSRGPRRTRLRE